MSGVGPDWEEWGQGPQEWWQLGHPTANWPTHPPLEPLGWQGWPRPVLRASLFPASRDTGHTSVSSPQQPWASCLHLALACRNLRFFIFFLEKPPWKRHSPRPFTALECPSFILQSLSTGPGTPGTAGPGRAGTCSCGQRPVMMATTKQIKDLGPQKPS